MHLLRRHRGDRLVILQLADAEREMLERGMSDQAFKALRRQTLASPKPQEVERRFDLSEPG